MIISHSTLGSNGRLGNQLFQLASTLGLAERYGATASFPDWAYKKHFEIPPTCMLPGPKCSPEVKEAYFHHHDWGLGQSDVDIRGYLQSEKYFGSQRLRLQDWFLEEQRSRHPIFDRETVCVHVRRGDYVGNSSYHQLTVGYYIDSLLTHFPNWRESNLLIVSDDTEYCKVHFGCLPNATFGSGTDVEDMALASLCDHFIISNSSFGWWCAWLGEKPHSKIVHCGRLHAGRLSSKDNSDYYPERWTSYRKDEYKVDLSDLTFTIPVHFDHQSRKENLDLSLYLLQSVFKSNYVVCEQGTSQFGYTAQWARYMKSDAPLFHRTRMLNDMCNEVKTPYLANWDCDVMIPPMQVILATELLQGGADMVYPYDGGFARMPRPQWWPILNKSLDIGVVRNAPLKGRDPSENSVGGAVLWNRDSFIDFGMENQHMVSFGPEDGERLDRAKKLGCRVERVKGSLFHLNHNVGVNSSPKNPHFNQNVLEQQKVFNMSTTELRAYVGSWPWRHPYTVRYYSEISEGAVRSARIVMAELEGLGVPTRRVLDVGCGVGEWSNGNADYRGIDYRVDRGKLLFNPENYSECNLNREMPELPRNKFDLALCLEVAEHLHPSRAELLVEYLCSVSDYVLFSAAIPNQGGSGHVNEQWQTYWAELFRKNGFGMCDKQPYVRGNEQVELWYRQNIVLYQRGAVGREVADFVLPEYYEQIIRGLKP